MNRIMESKIALVTGASRGIGKSIKEVLSKDGIEIISPNRNELDLSSSESIDKFLSQTSADIDIIINNAGILKVGEHNEFSSDDFHEILQVNVVAPFKIISGFTKYSGDFFSSLAKSITITLFGTPI